MKNLFFYSVFVGISKCTIITSTTQYYSLMQYRVVIANSRNWKRNKKKLKINDKNCKSVYSTAYLHETKRQLLLCIVDPWIDCASIANESQFVTKIISAFPDWNCFEQKTTLSDINFQIWKIYYESIHTLIIISGVNSIDSVLNEENKRNRYKSN